MKHNKVEKVWFCIMSFMVWCTLLLTPAIMIFPDINKTNKNYLFLIEFFWFLDIVRKLLF